MITHVSTQKTHQPKVVNLQIQFQPQDNDTLNHSPKKVKKKNNYRTTERSIKLLNVIQCLNLNDVSPEPSYRQIAQIVKQQKKNKHHSTNSYLAYKEQQKRQKQQPHSQFNFVKTKFKNHRKWLSTKYLSCRTQRVTGKPLQNSYAKRRASLVNLSDTFDGINDSHPSQQQRIYIKTSQGKRQKINANAYLTRIQDKKSAFLPFQLESILIHQKCSFALNNLSTQIKQVKQVKKPEYSILNVRRRMMSRQASKRQMAINLLVPEQGGEYRPWTDKSQMLT